MQTVLTNFLLDIINVRKYILTYLCSINYGSVNRLIAFVVIGLSILSISSQIKVQAALTNSINVSNRLSSLSHTCSHSVQDIRNRESENDCALPRFDPKIGTLKKFEIIIKGTRNTTLTLTNNTNQTQTLKYYTSTEGVLLWEGIDLNSIELPLGFNTEIFPTSPFVTDDLSISDESRISYTDTDILQLFSSSEFQTDFIQAKLRITDTSTHIEPLFSVNSSDNSTFDAQFIFSFTPNPSTVSEFENNNIAHNPNIIFSVKVPELFHNAQSKAVITLPKLWSINHINNIHSQLIVDTNDFPTYSIGLDEHIKELTFNIHARSAADQPVEIHFSSTEMNINPQTILLHSLEASTSESKDITLNTDTVRSGGAHSAMVFYVILILTIAILFSVYPLMNPHND